MEGLTNWTLESEVTLNSLLSKHFLITNCMKCKSILLFPKSHSLYLYFSRNLSLLNLLTFYSYVYDGSLEISEVKATIFSMQGFSVIFSPLSLCVHCDMLNLGDFSCNAKCVHFLKGSSRQCILYMMT